MIIGEVEHQRAVQLERTGVDAMYPQPVEQPDRGAAREGDGRILSGSRTQSVQIQTQIQPGQSRHNDRTSYL